MKIGLRWVSALVVMLVFACGEGGSLPDGWKPEGDIDCRLELSAESVELMGAVDLNIWVYVAGEKAPETSAPLVPPNFVGTVETRTRRHGGGWMVCHQMHLRPTEPGSLTIPSIPIQVGSAKTSTPAREIEVTSVLAAEDDPRHLEDPAAPFERAFPWWKVLAGAAALVAVAVGIWWLRRRRRRRPQPVPVESPVPPHVQAMRALARLRHAPRETETQVEEFYVGVSQVLRDYLEGRFGLHAPLRSTEEFLVEVERGNELSVPHRQSLRQFLQQCDLVKFARLIPGADDHEQTLRTAERFVDQTRVDAIGASASPQSVGGAA